MENNPLNLKNRKYLITGAASGIGRATSIFLSSLGAELLITDINQEGLEKTKSLCINPTFSICTDITDCETLKEKVLSAIPSFGTLNGFAHIAGRAHISPVKSITEKSCMDTFKLNTYVGVELAKIFTKRNVYSGENGSIVFISSVYGVVGSPANVGYAISKAGIIGATKALAMEFASKKIRVNCIAPGFVKTEMMASNNDSFADDYTEKLNNLHPLGLGEADDIAGCVAFLFSDMAKWITGSVMNVDGGFTAQ